MKSPLTLILDTLPSGRKEYVVGWMVPHDNPKDGVTLCDPANTNGWMAPGLNDFPAAAVVTSLTERDNELQAWEMIRGPKSWESPGQKSVAAILVKFPDGATVIRWTASRVGSTACYGRLADALLVHGHETEFREVV